MDEQNNTVENNEQIIEGKIFMYNLSNLFTLVLLNDTSNSFQSYLQRVLSYQMNSQWQVMHSRPRLTHSGEWSQKLIC